jgi:hypothetical protein
MVEVEYFVLGIGAGYHQLSAGPLGVRVENAHGPHFAWSKYLLKR